MEWDISGLYIFSASAYNGYWFTIAANLISHRLSEVNDILYILSLSLQLSIDLLLIPHYLRKRPIEKGLLRSYDPIVTRNGKRAIWCKLAQEAKVSILLHVSY